MIIIITRVAALDSELTLMSALRLGLAQGAQVKGPREMAASTGSEPEESGNKYPEARGGCSVLVSS